MINPVIYFIAVALSAAGCAGKNSVYDGRENAMPERTIQEVQKEHTNELMAVPGVVGTAIGICNGMPCIKVYVVKKTRELDRKIPDTIEGYPVMTEETGEFRRLPEN